MNRIFFRGKRIDNGKWIKGNYCFNFDNHEIEVPCIQTKPGAEYEVWIETVGQDTNISDKNYESIFNGDIVKDEYGHISKVMWDKNLGSWVVYNPKLNKITNLYHYCNVCKIEVIGNIYDNQKLLEVVK